MTKLIDLQDSSIADHWSKTDDSVSRILENMQSCENWTVDDDAAMKEALIKWVGSLDAKSIEDIIDNKPEDLTRIFAFMKSKRALFLLHKIENEFPGATSELLLESIGKIEDGVGDTRPYRILRDRLVALFRVDLLERIFSSDRSEKIKQSIKQVSEKYGGVYE